MKKALLLTACVFLGLSLFSQEIFIKQTVVINVEVPVRVFKDGKFVDNISIDDFEIFEEGIPQKIEAVYLIKKKTVEKREEKKRFSPETKRNFILLFEVSEYFAKLGEAVNYFAHNVIMPGDNLIIITPVKAYMLKDNTFEIKTREEIANSLKGILRKDVMSGNSEYRNTLSDLTSLARSISKRVESESLFPSDPEETEEGGIEQNWSDPHFGMDLDEQLIYYGSLLHKLEILRKINQMELSDFARFLKNQEGQKYVFLFYQREYLPQIEPRILNQYISSFQERPDIVTTITGLFDFYRRDVSFDVDRIKQTYSDSSVSIHFMYLTTPPKRAYGIRMEEHSEDLFAPFKEMAEATGGFVDSSSNPVSLFKNALDASENYYLLYYSPKNYTGDGKFKNIKVRVKNKNYKVTHRSGYFAN
ncbi:MAG: VWA domain-containing protein [Candidatus Aminicenantes bacterium]|nr:VWA domain-containing protein [Candidatus Aminicenantes bacterium]